jgi:multidrug efflux system membrane fusion protein
MRILKVSDVIQSENGRARRGSRIAALAAAVLAAGLAASCSKTEAAGKAADRRVPVTVAQAQKKTVPLEVRTFGAVRASATVTIKPEITGIVQTVHVLKGQAVHKGDLLFSIDPRPFDAALKQAQGNLARDVAQAHEAQLEAQRDEELFKKGISSASDHDKLIAAADALNAAVQADQAAVENAQLQLEHCSIRSPLDGRAGSLCIDQGNLAKVNDEMMAIINQISPVDVFFSITQSDLPALRQYMANGKLKVLATIPEQAQVEEGELTFIDNTVDRTTGTIMVGASFPNTQERLWPGQYVDVALTLAQQDDQVVVPARAVQTGQNGKYVLVVSADRSAQVRLVKVGQLLGLDVVVTDGLKGDETVVTDGHLRLTDGVKVEIKAPTDGQAASQPAQETAA